MIGLLITLLAIYLYWEPSTRYLSVFFVFFLITGGFQIVPANLMELSPAGVSKTHDWVLLYIGAILVIAPRDFLSLESWSKNKPVGVFLLTLLFLAAYSILYVGVEQTVVIRVLRNYLFFLVLIPFIQLPKEDFSKTLRLLVYATTVASALYCLQPFLGMTILNGPPLEGKENMEGLIRFYNLPFLLVPVIFLLFSRNKDLGVKFFGLLLAINLLAMLLSQHRNLLMTILLCYFIYLLISGKLQLKNVLVYGTLAAGLFIGVDTYFDNRFSKGIVELSESTKDVTPYYLYSTNISEVSTTEFRRLHFLERFYYAQEKVSTSLFGLGFLTEDSGLVDKFSFNIGLTSEYGEVAQVDTSDISWSVFVVHFGIIGTIILLSVYISYAFRFIQMRRYEYCKVGLLFTITLLIISFYGVEIIMPYSVTFIMFLGAYWHNISRTEENQPIGEKSDKGTFVRGFVNA
jgi:hypothetical protein